MLAFELNLRELHLDKKGLLIQLAQLILPHLSLIGETASFLQMHLFLKKQ